MKIRKMLLQNLKNNMKREHILLHISMNGGIQLDGGITQQTYLNAQYLFQ